METFEKLISEQKCVLVNFHTSWCDPCKMMAPIVDQIHQEQKEAHILKIDIDSNRSLSQQFGIKTFPTFILFKNGEAIWRRSGVVDKATLVREIAKSVG